MTCIIIQVEIGLRKRIEMADHIKMLEQQHDEALEQIEHMDMQVSKFVYTLIVVSPTK